MPKKNRLITLEPPLKTEKLIPGGFGLTTKPDGKKLMLLNTLPGEMITAYELTKSKSSYEEGIATNFETTSPHRLAPKDACYLSTSPFQIMDYTYELEQKRQILTEIFHSIITPTKSAAPTPLESPIEPAEPDRSAPIKTAAQTLEIPLPITDDHDFFYRNKMEYSLFYDHSDEKIHLAFHRRGSHQKFPIASSSLERPEIFEAAQKIVADLNAKSADSRKYQSLLLRCDASGKVSGGLYENHQPHPDFDNLTDEILGQKYSYSPNGFFQINLPVYELALKEIAKHIKTDHVLDLYSGVGTIGLSVAHLLENVPPLKNTLAQHNASPKNITLTLVESNTSAYRELERNCAEHKNVHPILAPSESVLDEIQPNATVIVDPPRAGLDKKLVNRLLEVKPPAIIYLSCNPVTQARDVERLLPTYRLTHLQPYNFFPRTPHLENLVVLEIE